MGDDQLIARRAVVIANGSTAAIPTIPGLDRVDFWTNRQAAIPRELPRSLAVLGAGAIGVELGQAFARLGSHVTLIEAGSTFLGLGGFTHLAHYHGQIIGRRLRGLNVIADHSAVPRVTYTDPEIASVGLTEAAARAQGITVAVAHSDPGEAARGFIHGFQGGAVKLVADLERAVLIGATLVTPRAGEIVGELVLAIKLRIPAFNRVLGTTIQELAAKTAIQLVARPKAITSSRRRSQ